MTMNGFACVRIVKFFKEVGAYITDIEYDNECLNTEGDDIDGDYFNSTFFKP
jgi:hypothetical protein